MPFSNEATVAVVAKVVRKYADVPGGLLPLLHEIQAKVGFIPKDCVAHIASGMGLSRAEVHGVSAFTTIFTTNPGGKKPSICVAPKLARQWARANSKHMSKLASVSTMVKQHRMVVFHWNRCIALGIAPVPPLFVLAMKPMPGLMRSVSMNCWMVSGHD